MSQVQSISAQEAFTRSQHGIALLICAYDSDDKFRHVHLKGAMALSSFKANLNHVASDKELIFYCA